ncbi:MAG: MBL fold metallo-hydrolase [Patescibacteria group bacterium]
MVITYHGLEFFKVTFGDTTVAFNPISKSSKYKSTSFGADIVLSTLNDEDFNGSKTAARGDKEPFVISGPGEYEYKNIFIQGYPSESNYKNKKRINTFYKVLLEDTSLCFLGALSGEKLTDYMKAFEGEVDVLFLPIGGSGVLNPEEAYKLAVSLEPKIIIPMHYGEVSDKNSLKTFLKESGKENLKSVDKLMLKKKDLIGKEGEVVLLAEI